MWFFSLHSFCHFIYHFHSQYLQAARNDHWTHATDEELNALKKKYHTWDLIPCPPHIEPLLDASGFIRSNLNLIIHWIKYKARLVALGNCQKYGIDYD